MNAYNLIVCQYVSLFQHFWAIMELFVLINFSRTPRRWNLQGNVLRLLQWTWRAGRFVLFLSSLGEKRHHQGVGWESGGNEVDFSSKRDALLVNSNTSDRAKPMEEEEGIMCLRTLPLFTPVSDCELGIIAADMQYAEVLSSQEVEMSKRQTVHCIAPVHTKHHGTIFMMQENHEIFLMSRVLE